MRRLSVDWKFGIVFPTGKALYRLIGVFCHGKSLFKPEPSVSTSALSVQSTAHADVPSELSDFAYRVVLTCGFGILSGSVQCAQQGLAE